ncbi:LiaI-LiaF-like domain-containing protein [Roseateles asaccharophilus]|uniref:Membrane protein n=1 Tax=Roseateles asaccharophilus TaxID=582607 RepID=A0ABU2AFH5_9BURK|nr:DUF5668 domain-containing protein [Roseateles asaccharophilus]MDR7335962.1 putative membrane protein [Roseateles asaccharophilus]
MQSTHIRHQNTGSQPGHRALFGLGLAAIGTLVLLGNLHIVDTALLRNFWPLALVLFGLARLAMPGRGRMAGIALVLVGAMLTAQNLGSDLFALRHWWPVFIIAAGLSMLRRGAHGAMQLQGDHIATQASFSNLQQRSDATDFQGGRIDLNCSNLELDLGNARLNAPEAVLQIDARLSGLTLRVPQGWQVVVEMSASAGSITDRTQPQAVGAPRLVLRGEALLGSVEIRH